MTQVREEILLLSARPEAREPLLNALRDAGVNVRVARRPDRALELLRGPAGLVLVDLEHVEALDDRVVATLNGRPATMMVIALHEAGTSPPRADGPGLDVDGYCQAGRPVFHARPGTIRTGIPSSL